MSKWIWRFGEFEIYHNLLVHNRRQQYGHTEPAAWKLYTPEPVVRFHRTVTTEGGTFRVFACGDYSVSVQTGSKPWEVENFYGSREITLSPGMVTVHVTVANRKTFPCLFVDGVIESDEQWTADDMTAQAAPVGCGESFDSPAKTPEVFPFASEPIAWKSREEVEGGVLFDFGKETFARVRISGLTGQTVVVRYGESREEAMDPVWSVIRFARRPEDGILAFPAFALRYLFVGDCGAVVEAQYEYLPLARRGSFCCGDEVIDRVWETAAYTFHLNCREFFLDGIKRDRWVWAADAYQSLFVNRYLFHDPAIEKRTLIALGGRRPVVQHINTIMDYTFFWVISLWEYYRTYGDRKFLSQIRPQLGEIMAFCGGREDPDGLMRGKPGDWIFIDWAPMDKEGALCGEQVLYSEALMCYGRILKTLGEDGEMSFSKAERIRRLVGERFYDPEKKVFIDSYESGRRNVTRHSNILAYLFLPLDAELKKNIYERVILNDEIRQITTPYFKFYENQVHLLAGNGAFLERSLREYYGGMLAAGATTLYEEYDPEMRGAAHYAMYGRPYEKSLCHAWSASPIYLLGCFRLGVKNTGIAYDSFEVRPNLGGLSGFSGTAPVGRGEVCVTADKEKVCVAADVPGGTLCVGGRTWKLEPGVEVTAAWEQTLEDGSGERRE